MTEERYLTFALAKGRLAFQTLELFEKMGISCEEMKDKKTRRLIFVNQERKLKFFLAKGPDVPTYVEYGAADIGVAGATRFWKRTGMCMRCWISASENAVCAYAARSLPGSCSSIMSESGWQANTPTLQRIISIIKSIRQ